MREILFRGKRTDNGEWVEGELIHSFYKIGDTCVRTSTPLLVKQVDHATVGQYTGMKDKTGKWIFEGDIVRLPELYGNEKAVIRFYGSAFRACGEAFSYQVSESMEVVGNIHDRQELMERR